MGYSQAVRHQTLTLAFSLVRIQLSQPKKRGTQRVPLFFGWDTNAKQVFAFWRSQMANTLVRIPAESRWELAHKRLGEEYSRRRIPSALIYNVFAREVHRNASLSFLAGIQMRSRCLHFGVAKWQTRWFAFTPKADEQIIVFYF